MGNCGSPTILRWSGGSADFVHALSRGGKGRYKSVQSRSEWSLLSNISNLWDQAVNAPPSTGHEVGVTEWFMRMKIM